MLLQSINTKDNTQAGHKRTNKLHNTCILVDLNVGDVGTGSRAILFSVLKKD
jgi:hypothetical protein